MGSSCKHVFCWTCISEITEGSLFPLCPLCSLPVGLQYVKPAAFTSQLFYSILSLKESLSQFDVSQIDPEIMLSVVEPIKQQRTINEFCASQVATDIDVIPDWDYSDVLSEINPEERPTVKTPCEFESHSEFSDPASNFALVPDDVILFTQPQEVVGEALADNQMTQHFHIYKEPNEFKFFQLQPRNTFGELTGMVDGSSENRSESQGREDSSVPSLADITTLSQHHKYLIVNCAVNGSKEELLKALKSGGDANDRDCHGMTALHHAAARDYSEICKILVENGAHINSYGGGQLCETALHTAVRYEAVNTVDYLLTKGADRHALNLKGQTPMDLIATDQMRVVFHRTSHSSKSPLSSRKTKEVSIFLSPTLPYTKLQHYLTDGDLLLNEIAKNTLNLKTASHLVVPVTASRTVEVTVEILEAMLRGKFVVASEWLDACLEAHNIVEEELYEIETINWNGQLLAKNSCSAARRSYAEMKLGLFNGCRFHFCKNEYSPYHENEIKNLVQLAGGEIIENESNVEHSQSTLDSYHAQSISELPGLFIVYMEGQLIPESTIERQSTTFVTPSWIIECIAKFVFTRPSSS
ncbi:unnamed protein product [Thelazia callipaeda]|uniref:BRCA1-associated RING domain protein 1 n=1 Tax=Thelazia callipaeda TaxID=103827 RepID=A0A0N5DAS2_THECL|nr:unnamed protein product [Thelazia callipaeda]